VPNSYVLGHADQELERLITQARLVDPITRRSFLEAGVGPGMRVLDVGSGPGDVSFLAAELIGATGEVIGVDRSPIAIRTATARKASLALANVSFVEGDPAELKFERPFDAVVGRYVLMFQPDPAAMLRRLATHLRPGGVLVFHEIDWNGARSHPPVPTYDRCCQWIVGTLAQSGADPRMGAKLAAIMKTAGLPAASLHVESLASAGPDSAELATFTADLARTLLPEMLRLGIATAEEVGIDALTARIRKEMIASTSTIIGRAEIGAWVRI
jgi:ubiquinone/menaquinone biosynthesis C-methylase UbiE